jgi:ankyrin repeat protein
MDNIEVNVNVDINELTCKLTGKIFLEPVIAEDGYTYEESALLRYFKTNAMSPLMSPTTALPMGITYHVNTLFIKLISALLIYKPQFKTRLYSTKFSFSELTTLLIKNLIAEAHDYLLLFDKIKIDISDVGRTELNRILFMNDNICKLLISKIDNLEAKYAYGYKLIHYVCKYNKNASVLQLLIDAKVDLECETDTYKCRPIHYICTRRNNNKMLCMLILANVNIESTSKDDCRPVHHVCKIRDNTNMLRVLINAGCNLECEDKFKSRPIHYVCCIPNNTAMLELLINAKVDLESINRHDIRAIHLCIREQCIHMLKILLNAGIDADCKSMTHSPIELVCSHSNDVDLLECIFNASRDSINVANLIKLLRTVNTKRDTDEMINFLMNK